jgi:hypothetical protein
MDTKKEFISPERAKHLLTKNFDNRSVSKDAVEQYARDMRNGEWKLTHQSILLGQNDCIIDGQHRLMAIAKSGVGQWSLVSRDTALSSARELPLDVGMKRRVSYILGTSARLTSVAKFAFRVHRGLNTNSPADLKPYMTVLDTPLEQVVYNCKVAKRSITTAPVQLAGAVVILNAGDADYVNRVYLAMAYDRFAELPPIVSSFYRQVIVDRIQYTAGQIFARAVRIFDVDKQNVSRLYIRDEAVAYAEAQQLLSNVMEATS